MESTPELTEALNQWRDLSELEGRAIVDGDWQGVSEQQNRKEQLQATIQRAVAMQGGLADGFPVPERMTDEVTCLVESLIEMEKRNAGLIATARQHFMAESAHLSKSLRDLRGVRRAYGSDYRPNWHSYS